jgi:ATP-dependent DNA helicase PIF1
MAKVEGGDKQDEIEQFQDMRSIGASEACWRLLEFNLGDRYPSVQMLQVHLEHRQSVLFEEGCAKEAVAKSDITTLTAFFDWNKAHQATDVQPHLRLTYQGFPEEFKYQNQMWSERAKHSDTIGRIVSLHPSIGDVFYLRMLLCNEHCIGKTSFEDMRSIKGQVFASYKAVCAKLGLLQDDNEWDEALTDAAETQMCPQIRELFVEILLFCAPADPLALFSLHCHEWWDDYKYHARASPGVDVQLLRGLVLIDLEERLGVESKSLSNFGLPEIKEELRARCTEFATPLQPASMPYELRYQLDSDRRALQSELDTRLYGDADGKGQYLPAQRAIHDAVMHAVTNPGSVNRCFNLDARAGTGKTYVQNGLLAAVRLLRKDAIALAVAVSATAGIQLSKGSTFHSTFKVPIIGLDSTTIFNITPGSAIAQIMLNCEIIIWDEAPMAHKHLLEALDRTLQDLCGDQRPFANKVLVLSGDFRQVLPVIPRASRAAIVNASLKKSFLWHHFHTLTLTENMRILRSGNSEAFVTFDQLLLTIGDGTMPTIHPPDWVLLPELQCVSIDNSTPGTVQQSMQRLVDWTFPNLAQHYNDVAWLSKRAIFAPTNSAVDQLNDMCIGNMPGDIIVLHSADSVSNPEQACDFGVEFLHSLHMPGMPQHRLALKTGCMLMLLRNLSKRRGLCNGTRLIFKGVVGNYVLQCQIANGDFAGTDVLIPRIPFQPSSWVGQPCEWTRMQFPVKIAFAMTINKSQGQTLKQVGVWLFEPVFTHGQLYVAASRVGDPRCILFAIKRHEGLPWNATRNVVYREVLD